MILPARRHISRRITDLDPEADHQEIVRLLTCHVFAWDFERSLELALFRTYAVPSISAILAESGEFFRRPRKRYDDTELIMYELVEHGYDSDRGRRALRRMNQMHHRFDITNDDMLYVLSTFVFEPIRWIDRFGRRPLTRGERMAIHAFFRQVGRRMGIRGIPSDLDAFDLWNRDYERENFGFSPDNRRVGTATLELLLGMSVPRPLWPIARPVALSLMEDELLDAFGFDRPPARLRAVTTSVFRLRGRIARLLPERRNPALGTERRRPTYPEGYEIEGLGTFG